jgi:hypothetical protein
MCVCVCVCKLWCLQGFSAGQFAQISLSLSLSLSLTHTHTPRMEWHGHLGCQKSEFFLAVPQQALSHFYFVPTKVQELGVSDPPLQPILAPHLILHSKLNFQRSEIKLWLPSPQPFGQPGYTSGQIHSGPAPRRRQEGLTQHR